MEYRSTEGMSEQRNSKSIKPWNMPADTSVDDADADVRFSDELHELDRLIDYQNCVAPRQDGPPQGFFSPVQPPCQNFNDIPDGGDGPPQRLHDRVNSFNSVCSSDPRQDDAVISSVIQPGRHSPSFKRRRDQAAESFRPPSHSPCITDDSNTDTGATDAFETMNVRDEEDDSTASAAPRRVSRVAHACSNCKKSKTKCDTRRPCSRCVRLHKASTCKDSVHQKRGRKPQPKGEAKPKPRERRQRRHTRHKSVASIPSMQRSITYDNLTYPPNIATMHNAVFANAHMQPAPQMMPSPFFTSQSQPNMILLDQAQSLFPQQPPPQTYARPGSGHEDPHPHPPQPGGLIHSTSAPVINLHAWKNSRGAVSKKEAQAQVKVERERSRRARREHRSHQRHRSDPSISLNQVLSTPTKIEYLRALSSDAVSSRQIRVMNEPLSVPTRPVETRDKKA